MPFTPPTPNLADPLSVDQSQIQTPTSQQHTSPQKDTFHNTYHRQSKKALIFNDAGPHDSTQLPYPRPLKDYADSSKENLYKDDDSPAPGLSKKQRLSISSPEKFVVLGKAHETFGEDLIPSLAFGCAWALVVVAALI
ncbi:hypothetical protein POTOM_061983 [Populus tomentosa]|uniref:Uncharacterized protein n=1 Tax=Populus tomentosa TaxID=118781 RepID=A0A8X8BV49_POPTO|nr:hypothetical protein POTOM_061983 [Populus tomentosa]